MLIEKTSSTIHLENQVKQFEFFFDSIKECKPNQYISLTRQVCSIEEICIFNKNYELRQLLKPSKIKKIKPCACLARNRFRCGKNYCTDNKQTCDKVKNYLNDSVYSKYINKC